MKFNRLAFEIICAQKCLSIKEVSKMSGISATTIQNISKRKAKPNTIGKIARALDVPVTAIIIDEPDQEVTA